MADAKELVTAYSVRYCLSVGIQRMEGEVAGSGIFCWKGDYGYLQFVPKSQWFLTLEEAQAKANEMRRKKIASLTKQIARLESLEFAKAVEEKN